MWFWSFPGGLYVLRMSLNTGCSSGAGGAGDEKSIREPVGGGGLRSTEGVRE